MMCQWRVCLGIHSPPLAPGSLSWTSPAPASASAAGRWETGRWEAGSEGGDLQSQAPPRALGGGEGRREEGGEVELLIPSSHQLTSRLCFLGLCVLQCLCAASPWIYKKKAEPFSEESIQGVDAHAHKYYFQCMLVVKPINWASYPGLFMQGLGCGVTVCTHCRGSPN